MTVFGSDIPPSAPEIRQIGAAKDRATRLATWLEMDSLLHIVDIGANPMAHDTPYRMILDAGLARVTGFEPQEDAFAGLQAEKGSNETYFNLAISDGNSHQLNLYKGHGLASALSIREPTIGCLHALSWAGQKIGEATIDTVRIDDVPDLGYVDFLKIDIQGGELAVFEHGARILSEASAVQTEVAFFPLYEDQPMFADVDAFLRQRGFVLHSFPHIVRRALRFPGYRAVPNLPASQVLDGDAIYLRDFSQIETMTVQRLKMTCLLADAVFQSFDLSLRCLNELVRRNIVQRRLFRRYRTEIVEALSE